MQQTALIKFRCWYCNRRYSMSDERIGNRFTCSCERELRVPKRSGGRCRVKSPVDWLVEAVVYGGGGALLGFGLSMLILSRWRGVAGLEWTGWLVAGHTLFGFLIGALGGERAIDWLGRSIRDRE
jgi:hypothetical protein